MKLTTTYQGGKDPFERDRTLWLRSLPAGGRVTRATVKLTPAVFADSIIFDDQTGVGEWGATRDPAALTQANHQATASLHARRTVTAVAASREIDQGRVTVQVDMGGTWVAVATDGTILASDKQPLVLSLPVTPASGQPASTALPTMTTEKVKLTAVSNDESLVDPNGDVSFYGLTIRSVPTNVSVRLGEMPPFWTYLGELATAQTSPDFAAVLNAFLAEASAEDGFYAIPFVVHSDTIARLDVTLAIDYVVEQPILPSYLPEVAMPYGYSSLPGVEEGLLTLNLPRGATIAGTGGAVQGTFDATRVVSGEIGESGATATATVSPDQALAQPIQLAAETPVSGIDLPLANTQPGLAGLHLALQADADGKPSGQVLTSAEVRVEKPVPGGSAWGSAALPAEFRFLPDERYWLVLQSVSGEAYWDVTPSEPGEIALQATASGGLSWRMAATDKGQKPLAAVYRLRHTPERFSVPLQLQLGEEPDAVRVRFDRFAPLGRVEFDVDFAAGLEEYLDSPSAVSPCGAGELLTNGGFDQPPHDDATRRLFGFDAGRARGTGGDEDSGSPASLTGTVSLGHQIDLSVQRYIRLSVDDQEPVRIDCAGAIPERTTPEEVVAAINRTVGMDVATYDPPLSIISPTSGTSSTIELHAWCRLQVPEGWRGEPGRVLRAKREERVLAGLIAPPSLVADLELLCFNGGTSGLNPLEPAELAQRAPVVGGCAYVLRFLHWNAAGSASEGESVTSVSVALLALAAFPEVEAPFWEISWLGADGQLIGSESQTLGQEMLFARTEDWLFQGEALLIAPAGAVEAEVRFVQPAPGALALADVSLVPTPETVANAAFRLWETQILAGQWIRFPVGWTVLSGLVDRYTEGGSLRGARLRGTTPGGFSPSGDTILAQRVTVSAGVSYQLQVNARPVPAPANDPEMRPVGQRARLELRWLADDSAIGEPVILPLDGRDFPTHAWAGAAPEGASQAEIRLIQPQGGGDLLVESVSLSRADMVSVPLTFLAEAPGELTVSDLRVAYHPPEPPARPQLPAAAAVRTGARVAAPEPSAVEPIVELAAPPPSPLSDHSIGIVAGVGDRFSSIFRGLPTPVTTVAELAALDPEVEIENITRERRLELKTAAEMITAIPVDPTAFRALAGESLETLLFAAPDDLVARSARPRLEVNVLQRDLRVLRLLLKNEAFRSLRLSDLMPGGA